MAFRRAAPTPSTGPYCSAAATSPPPALLMGAASVDLGELPDRYAG
jgi:hypothetical protein